MSEQQGSEPPITENTRENPIADIDDDDLEGYIHDLFEKNFKNSYSVTKNELLIGAKLAKNFGTHDDEIDKNTVEQGKTTPPFTFESEVLGKREKKALRIQRSLAFWDEPKDLLVTLVACCMASLTQGWDQVANGNLGWPQDFGLSIQPGGTGKDIWRFGAINAITWFSAAILGPFLVDPVCHSKLFGRRGAVFLAAIFSCASMIGGSRAQSWQGYMISRLFLGIGIGAKASMVPIWESEILPQAKRGRLLVSWQVFTALGIFAGSVATYIFRDTWRNQVLSGALPAFILLILTFFCCESPRWLILQGRYPAAFKTLVRLRKERILAAEELCYIHFQIQAERYVLVEKPLDFDKPIERKNISPKPKSNKPEGSEGLEESEESKTPQITYFLRLKRLGKIDRNRRAAIASMIVMISQQLSGINILAFLASVFFSTADLSKTTSSSANTNNSLGFGIGFGAANFVFSTIAYFLIEPLEVEKSTLTPDEEEGEQDEEVRGEGERESAVPIKRRKRLLARLSGRRSLLLLSLSSGAVVLFILTFLLDLKDTNSAKLPVVCLFIILFTFCYSPGAGCVPFVYSSEVWPNEGREIGMSWAVFWNFLGAGLLALFVPRGFQWGHSRLFGLFTGLSVLGFLLVWFFVPATDHAMSLEDMSNKFKPPLREHGKKQLKALKPDVQKIKKSFAALKSKKKGGKVALGAVNGTEGESGIADKTADVTVDETADKTAEKTVDETVNEAVDETADKTAEKTVDETANGVEDDKTVD